jgi:hypothetical protein
MGTTVFGADSPTSKDIADKAESAATAVSNAVVTDENNTEVDIVKEPLSNEQYSATVTQVKQLEEKLGVEASLLGAVELTATKGYTGKLTVTLRLSGITSTDSVNNIRILHYNGTSWETITPISVEAGSVTVTLTSLSPVAVVRTTATNTGGSDADNTATDTNPSNTYNTYNTYNYAGNNKPDTLSQTNGSNTSTSRTGDSSSGGNTQTNNNYQTVNVYPTGNGTSTSAQTSASTSTTSPKTGASLPAFPIIAILAVMGIAVCGKKAHSLS